MHHCAPTTAFFKQLDAASFRVLDYVAGTCTRCSAGMTGEQKLAHVCAGVTPETKGQASCLILDRGFFVWSHEVYRYPEVFEEKLVPASVDAAPYLRTCSS